MKSSASLLFLFLIVAGCSDTINSPSGLTAPTSATGALRGNPPPPPADVAVTVCAPGGCTVADGTYFSNGADDVATAAITQALEGGCAFPDATSWLKFGNSAATDGLETTTSANAQIRCHNGRAAGNGKISYESGAQYIEIKFQDVLTFVNTPECSVASPFCATFTATVTIDGVPAGIATGQAINREFYKENCDLGEGGSYCGGID